MHEHRHLTRWRLIYYLRVFDRNTDELLGHVVDMTVEGMMLVSAEPIPTDQEFDVCMEFPSEDGPRGRVEFTARSVWTNTDASEDFHDTGFRLLDPPAETILRIQDLIEDLRFPGPPGPITSPYGLRTEPLPTGPGGRSRPPADRHD